VKIYHHDGTEVADIYVMGIRYINIKLEYLVAQVESTQPGWVSAETFFVATHRLPAAWVFVSPHPETPDDVNSFLLTYPEWINMDKEKTQWWISEGREPEMGIFHRLRREMIAELKYVDRGNPPTSPRPPIEPIG
jgi:hypothetical protein